MSSRIARSDGVICAAVDGEVVALNIEKGVCYGLDAIGSEVWDLIAEPRSIADICQTLRSRYRVEQAVCESDVLALIADLRDEGLAMLLPAPPEPSAAL